MVMIGKNSTSQISTTPTQASFANDSIHQLGITHIFYPHIFFIIIIMVKTHYDKSVENPGK